MARKAVIKREIKRKAIVKKFADKRAKLFSVINDANASDEERANARTFNCYQEIQVRYA